MPEFERLSERALLLADRGDVVCLARPVDDGYLGFLDALELGPRREDILGVEGVRPGRGLAACLFRDPDAMDAVLRRLSGAGSIVVSPFFPSASAFALGRAIEGRLSGDVRVEGGSAEMARELHDKVQARSLAMSLGIPVAPGEVVGLGRVENGRARDTRALREAIERWSEITGHVIVRGASGASGSSIFTSRSGSVAEMIDAIEERSDNALYLVEPMFEARFSPNIEVLVEPNLPALVGASEQVLDRNLVYLGSVHPSPARRLPRMEEDARAIVSWMRRRGFSGRVGFDFVEHAGLGGEPAHFLTEINPRINGASYPLALLRRLVALAIRLQAPAPAAFRTGWVSVRASEYGELASLSRSLLYDPARGEGIVPYSVGALAVGHVGIACFGRTPAAVDGLQREFVRVAGVPAGPAESADAA
jgi:hypothetical protein